MISTKIIQAANQNKNEPAVYYGGRYYSYAELIAFADELIWLKGKKVVLTYEKSFEYVAFVFASIVNQFTFIPMSLKNPQNRNVKIIQDVKPDYIMGSNNEKIGEYAILTKNDLPRFNHTRQVDQEYLSYIIYTSGSTGSPKGVVVSSSGLDNVIGQQVEIFNLKKSKIFFYVNTVFDASISDMLCSFYSGSCLYIEDPIKTKFESLKEYIINHSIEFIDLPPSVLPYLNLESLKSLKTIIVGGEIPNYKSIQNSAKFVNIFNVYGPTEASICTSIHKCDQSFNSALIGKPLNNMEYRILDGELLISGICLARGYTDEKLTEQSFILIEGIRYYKTGDLVSLVDDNYIFLGRKDSQVKYKGQLVNMDEIVSVVKKHPSVKDAFAYFDKEIFLIIEGDEFNLIPYLKENVPAYMLPKKIFFEDKFKRNTSAKIDKESILSYYDFYLDKKVDKLIEQMGNKQDSLVSGDKILITGSTGFLGIHLLSHLSKDQSLICLVRAKNEQDGLIRLQMKAIEHKLSINWNNIQVVNGDCLLPDLGIKPEIKKQIMKVVHCAAEVNNLKGYDQLYQNNVLATMNVIQFSQGIKLELISTLSVFVSSQYSRLQSFKEQPLAVEYRKLHSGYAATKWQAERLAVRCVDKENLSIYRLGLLTESLDSNVSLSHSFLFLLIKKLKEVETIPDIEQNLYIDLTPISMVARDLSFILKQKQNNTYNVSYNVKLSYKEISNSLCKPMILPSEWFKNHKYNILSKLMSVANTKNKKELNMNIFETTMVSTFENENFLSDSKPPRIEEKEIKKQYFKNWGLSYE